MLGCTRAQGDRLWTAARHPMTFLNPQLFVAGLACVAVPILIHLLLRRRRKPVPWAAMKFLLEAYKQQRRRTKLEQILLLAARCLVVGLIALAIGRPIFSGGPTGVGPRVPRQVFIVIDNSLTATAKEDGEAGVGGDALASHIRQAAAMVRGLDAARGDTAALVTLAGPASAVVMPASNDLIAVASLIESIAASDGRADWAGAAAAITPQLPEGVDSSPATVAVFSEFRAGSIDLSVEPAAALRRGGAAGPAVRLIAVRPSGTALVNQSLADASIIDGVLLSSGSTAAGAAGAGGSAGVRVRVTRSGDGALPAGESQLRAWISPRGEEAASNELAARETLRWAAGEREKSLVMRVPVPARLTPADRPLLRATLERDAIEADNTITIPVALRDQVRVALVGLRARAGGSAIESFGPGDWMALALEPRRDDPVAGRRAEMAVEWVDPSAAGALDPDVIDAVVVTSPERLDDDGWTRIAEIRRRGGVVMITPPAAERVNLWTDRIASALIEPWEMDREWVTFGTPVTIAWEGRPRPAVDLLGQIGGEMQSLARAASISRMLPIRFSADAGHVQMWADGPTGPVPLIVSSVPSMRGGVVNEGTAERAAAPREDPRAGLGAEPAGTLIVFAVSPDLTWTSLPAKPLMVPLVQELIRQSVARSMSSGLMIAGARVVAPAGAAQLRPLVGARRGDGAVGGDTLAVGPDGLTIAPVRSRGVWLSVDARGTASARGGGIVCVNADSAAGRVETQRQDDVQRWLGAFAGTNAGGGAEQNSATVAWMGAEGPIAAAGEGAGATPITVDDRTGPSWGLLLFAAALGLAILELVMSRRFSHATTRSARGGEAGAGGGRFAA